jgi:hypothetical protein
MSDKTGKSYIDWLPIQDRITRWLNKNFVVEE